jgi:hypothetical protein
MKTPNHLKQIKLTGFVLRNILALLDEVVWHLDVNSPCSATPLPILDKEKDRDREVKKASEL